MSDSAPDRRGRASVTTYLLGAFAVCAASLTLVTVQSSRTSFDRGREQARQDLRSITRDTQASAANSLTEIEPLLRGFAADPKVRSLDPQQCEQAFAGLQGILQGEHVHVFAASGVEVCSAYGKLAKPAALDRTTWFSEVVEQGKTITLPPEVDPASGLPAVLFGVPLMGASGTPIGALVAVTTTTRSAIVVPPDAPKGAVILLLDANHDLVLGASANAPAATGERVGSSVLGRSLQPGRTVTDLDGQKRIYEETVVTSTGWHVLAGVSSDVAFASARADLRRNELAGGVTLGLLVLLGLLLHRRLARPIQRVGQAIGASLDGDRTARAPVGGPAELARVASAFNELIEERHDREADLHSRARRDALTGLPNRTALTERLDEVLAAAVGDPEKNVVVVFLDLDRFKHINDAFGHATGDRVLVALGDRLVDALDGMFVARFGGDEYVMVATGPHTTKTASALAKRVATTMQVPFEIEGSYLHLTGSIGIAVRCPGDTAEDLIRNADTAMYRSKEAGINGYAVFDQPMRDWVMHRASMESDLHQAIESGQLWLGFQPKMSLDQTAPMSFEALARWSHPTRGLVPPAEFIPVAEETGLITIIGTWALEEACRQAAAWRELNGGCHVPVAVNLSARQLAEPRLPDLIAQILERTGAEPRDLVLEVTESGVLVDAPGVSSRLRRLRDAGVRISIDDFGTGYSSLSYLQQLPIDELKIDQTFVARLPFEPSSTAIIGSVINLAHAIGLKVVAEGVETAAQITSLRDLNCDLAQGFYIARPERAPEATARLLDDIAGIGVLRGAGTLVDPAGAPLRESGLHRPYPRRL